jgi:hypothetical protein
MVYAKIKPPFKIAVKKKEETKFLYQKLELISKREKMDMDLTIFNFFPVYLEQKQR